MRIAYCSGSGFRRDASRTRSVSVVRVPSAGLTGGPPRPPGPADVDEEQQRGEEEQGHGSREEGLPPVPLGCAGPGCDQRQDDGRAVQHARRPPADRAARDPPTVRRRRTPGRQQQPCGQHCHRQREHGERAPERAELHGPRGHRRRQGHRSRRTRHRPGRSSYRRHALPLPADRLPHAQPVCCQYSTSPRSTYGTSARRSDSPPCATTRYLPSKVTVSRSARHRRVQVSVSRS
ncbi:hypothetical protein SSPIM334S_05117 [Streptomyces spiroverticillatus]